MESKPESWKEMKEAQGEWKKQERLSKIMAESQRFFVANLYGPAGKECLNYLRGRWLHR